MLSVWHNHVKLKTSHRQKQQTFADERKIYLIQNYFKLLLRFHENKNEEKFFMKNKTSAEFYNKGLVRRVLCGLKEVTDKFRWRETRKIKLLSFAEGLIVKEYLSHLQQILDRRLNEKFLQEKASSSRNKLICDETLKVMLTKLKEKQVMKEVISYHNNILFLNYFHLWRRFVTETKEKAKKTEQAQQFHYFALKMKFMSSWKELLMKNKMADKLYEEKLMRKALTQLRAVSRTERNICKKVDSFRKKKEDEIKFRALQTWKRQIELFYEKIKFAGNFHNNIIISSSFYKWKKYVHVEKGKKTEFGDNYQRITKIKLEEIIFTWREMWARKQTLQRNVELFKKSQRKRFAQNYLRKWEGFVNKQKEIKGKCATFAEMKSEILIQIYLIGMKQINKNKIKFSIKQQALTSLKKMSVKRKSFEKWAKFVEWKKSLCGEESDSKTRRKQRMSPRIPDYMLVQFGKFHLCCSRLWSSWANKII